MEEKNKKIFIISSCIIAVLVISLIIGIIPKLLLKTNESNKYNDAMKLGDDCENETTYCSSGASNILNGKCYQYREITVDAQSCQDEHGVYSEGYCYSEEIPMSTTCTSCVPGRYIVGNACKICPAGSKCEDGINAVKCDPGTYNTQDGLNYCSSCPAGKYNTTYGSKICYECSNLGEKEYCTTYHTKATCAGDKVANAAHDGCVDPELPKAVITCTNATVGDGSADENGFYIIATCDGCKSMSSYKTASAEINMTVTGEGDSTHANPDSKTCKLKGQNSTVGCVATVECNTNGTIKCTNCETVSTRQDSTNNIINYDVQGINDCEFSGGSNTKNISCCMVGYTKNASGKCVENEKEECLAGEYLSDDGTTCETCPNNYKNSNVGSDSINDCYAVVDAGYEIRTAGAAPTACTGNKYSSSKRNVYYGKDSPCSECTGDNKEVNDSHTACAFRKIDCCVRGQDGKYEWKLNTEINKCNVNNATSPSLCEKLNNPALTETECKNIANHYWVGDSCVECPNGFKADSSNKVCHISVPAGSYLVSAGTPGINSCPVGTYSRGGVYNLSGSSDDVVGVSSCKSCGVGKTSPIGSTSSDACVPETKQCSVSVTTSAKDGVISKGDTWTVKISVSGDGCNGGTLKLSAINSERSGSNENIIVYDGNGFNIPYIVTNDCVTTTVTANIEKNGSSVAHNSVSVKTSSKWHLQSENVCVPKSDYDNHKHSAKAADDAGVDIYYIIKDNANCVEGQNDYRRVDIYVRGCNGATTPVPPTEEACYANAEKLTKATKTVWAKQKPSSWSKITKDLKGQTIISEEQCKLCFVNKTTQQYEWTNEKPGDGYEPDPTILEKSACIKPATPPSPPVIEYACYGTSETLSVGVKTAWATGPFNDYKYKIKYGSDGKEIEIKSATDCVAPETPPTIKRACYADAPTLKDATKVSIQQEATTEYPYEIKVSSLSDCKIDTVKYCYANAGTLEDATQVGMLTEAVYQSKLNDPTFKLRYQVKDSSGKYIVDSKLCVASACYENPTTGDYKWAKIGTLDSSYKKVDIYKESLCVNPAACMAKPSKDGYSDFKWITTTKDKNGLLKDGYVELNATYEECKNTAACYQKDTDFVWSTTQPEGYTKVEDSKCSPSVEPHEDNKCYIHKQPDGRTDYVWGSHDNDDEYKEIDIPEEMCKSNVACYLNTLDGTYHSGDYSANPDYNLADDSNCNIIPAPPTSVNRNIALYVGMIFLAIAGVGLVYYGNYQKKNIKI